MCLISRDEALKQCESFESSKVFSRLLIISFAICCIAALTGFLLYEEPADSLEAKGAVSFALSYFLSSLCGCVSALIPLAVSYFSERKGRDCCSAGTAFLEVLKTEFYRYALLIVLTGCFFKFLTLPAGAFFSGLASVLLADTVLRAVYGMSFSSENKRC